MVKNIISYGFEVIFKTNVKKFAIGIVREDKTVENISWYQLKTELRHRIDGLNANKRILSVLNPIISLKNHHVVFRPLHYKYRPSLLNGKKCVTYLKNVSLVCSVHVMSLQRKYEFLFVTECVFRLTLGRLLHGTFCPTVSCACCGTISISFRKKNKTRTGRELDCRSSTETSGGFARVYDRRVELTDQTPRTQPAKRIHATCNGFSLPPNRASYAGTCSASKLVAFTPGESCT